MLRLAVRMGLCVAALSLLVSLSPSEVWADVGEVDGPTTGAVAGVVLDIDGTPVECARVRLVTRHSRRVVARRVTNENGRFGFREVHIGRYLVVAAKRDVGRGRARVTVHPNEVSRVRVVIGE